MGERLIHASLIPAILAAGNSVYAAQPLITEDVYTQGRGNFQLEVEFGRSWDKQGGRDTRLDQLAPVLSYGFVESADLLLSLPPYMESRTASAGATTRFSGVGDTTAEVKWRFYESGAVSLAVKPGISFATGDSTKGLGSGRTTGSGFLVATFERAAWTYHLHTGYVRNRNSVDQRKDLFHLSGATTYQAMEKLKLAAEFSWDTNPDKRTASGLAVVLGGLIYSPRPNLDLDLGIRAGLTHATPDYALLAGMTVRW